MFSFSLLLQILYLVVGFILLIKGADWFVEGASQLAGKFHIPQLVIGLTIVAFGTSAPEAAISITSALAGNTDITIGNIVGSNIINVFIILGLTSIIIPLTVQKSTLYVELPFVIFATLCLGILGLNDFRISFAEGIILLILLLIFMGYLLYQSLNNRNSELEQDLNVQYISNYKMILLIIVGIVAIAYGSEVTVNSATNIATAFHMSERLIGLTIVAFGTSLPELVTSVTAGRKGESDIAIGNIVGSNIFNILFVCAVTALITPVPFANSFYVDICIASLSVILLLIFLYPKKRLTRGAGITMLIIYAFYFIYLLYR